MSVFIRGARNDDVETIKYLATIIKKSMFCLLHRGLCVFYILLDLLLLTTNIM